MSMDFFPSAFDFFNPSSSDNKLIIFLILIFQLEELKSRTSAEVIFQNHSFLFCSVKTDEKFCQDNEIC